jgi:4-hydroxy-3-methylbut-2-en-1-yl diphosphate reductase
MEIRLAKSYGFCFGVKRAIKIAENASNAVTIGPLIHNNAEINRLKENFNVTTLHDIHEAKDAKKAIIRTHGIPKNDLEQLHANNAEVIDATCPYVTKPQEICEKMSQDGYEIVIFGDANHPEVKGVASYAIHGAVVIQSVEELSHAKLRGQKVAVVSQTTRKINEFLEITHYLESRYKEVRVFNTICNATFENQDAAKDLAKEADVVVIIGGKNSSNTKQLHSICKEYCEDSFLVEDEHDLDEKWFEGKHLCGVTAGASTPDWIIEKIVGKISEIKV